MTPIVLRPGIPSIAGGDSPADRDSTSVAEKEATNLPSPFVQDKKPQATQTVLSHSNPPIANKRQREQVRSVPDEIRGQAPPALKNQSNITPVKKVEEKLILKEKVVENLVKDKKAPVVATATVKKTEPVSTPPPMIAKPIVAKKAIPTVPSTSVFPSAFKVEEKHPESVPQAEATALPEQMIQEKEGVKVSLPQDTILEKQVAELPTAEKVSDAVSAAPSESPDWLQFAVTSPATTPPIPTTPAPALPNTKKGGTGQYTIQVGSFLIKEEADQLSSTLQGKGYSPYVTSAEIPSKGKVYRVRVGQYPNRPTAQAEGEKLAQKESLSFFITSK